MQGYMLAGRALEYVCDNYAFQTVLDIGAGEGLHAARFRRLGKTVVELDSSDHWQGPTDIREDFVGHRFDEPFDLVWCSHVLEHQTNVGLFLRKIFDTLKPGGVFAITVPPWKMNIVGGHLTIWNAGLLLYNLILAGFDCRDARVLKHEYNISVIGRKRHAALPRLKMDKGDIELLAPYFPSPMHQDIDGDFDEINWSLPPDLRPPASGALGAGELTIEAFRELAPSGSDLDNLLWSASCIGRSGDIAEFGVFEGRSLRALAAAFPDRTIHGLDSFRGLPEPWVRSETSTYERGHFALREPPADMPANVKLFPGFFRDTLPVWSNTLNGPLSLIHVDADLCSAARDVLFALDGRIVPGTVIVFDELCDWMDSGVYPAWPEGEWRALREWMSEKRRRVRLLSRGSSYAGSIVVAE
jgi:SAM-dependent methyltransferase